jgi:hypothetical protein
MRASQKRRIEYAREAVNYVRCNFPPGTRLRCKNNGKTYQIGTTYGMSGYWMLDEAAAKRGVVSAATIMDHFDNA